jgi:hypothetical protein
VEFIYRLAIKTYYSIQHLKSSYLLIEESQRIESSDLSLLEGIEKVELSSRNLAFVTGAIFSTIAFIEASINELLSDISQNDDRVKTLPKDNKKAIKDLWDKEDRGSLEKWSTLKKYQKTLELLDKEKFDEASELFENVSLLVELRNTLMHFKPEWNSIHSPYLSENENQHKLTSKLEGKFELSVFFKNSGNPFFPSKCMGYGCAEWSLKNAVIFVDEFYRRIGIKPNYDHVRKDL